MGHFVGVLGVNVGVVLRGDDPHKRHGFMRVWIGCGSCGSLFRKGNGVFYIVKNDSQ